MHVAAPVSVKLTMKFPMYAPLHVHASLGNLEELKKNHRKNIEIFNSFLNLDGGIQQPRASTPYSIDIRNKHGMTSLHCASYYGRINTMFYLLEQGSDVNAFSTFGYSIHQSASSMVDAPENVAKNATTQTRIWANALHFAASNGHRNAVILLLNRGIDPLALDFKGYSASQIALMHGHKRTAEIIDYFSGKFPKSTSARREIILKIEACKKNIHDIISVCDSLSNENIAGAATNTSDLKSRITASQVSEVSELATDISNKVPGKTVTSSSFHSTSSLPIVQGSINEDVNDEELVNDLLSASQSNISTLFTKN